MELLLSATMLHVYCTEEDDADPESLEVSPCPAYWYRPLLTPISSLVSVAIGSCSVL